MKILIPVTILFGILFAFTGCSNQPRQVVFEIAENIRGLIILIDDEESTLGFETLGDSYHLSIDDSGIIKVRGNYSGAQDCGSSG
jgi:hypothetical protein